MRGKHGFTLVELAIVLVIIGLLVGGVLVGQDLIASAKINATVSDIQSYTTAAMTFRDKYNGIPGDLRYDRAQQAGLTVCSSSPGSYGAGDGDGLLQNEVPSTYTPNFRDGLGGETELFWRQLTDAGLIPFQSAGTCTAVDTTNFATGSTAQTALQPLIPSIRLRDGGFVHAFGINGVNNFAVASFVLGCSGACTSGRLTPSSIFSGREAQGIDSKFDDGNPAAGSVMSAFVGYGLAPETSPPPGNGGGGSGAPNYNTTNTACYNTTTLAYGYGDLVRCALRIRAGF